MSGPSPHVCIRCLTLIPGLSRVRRVPEPSPPAAESLRVSSRSETPSRLWEGGLPPGPRGDQAAGEEGAGGWLGGAPAAGPAGPRCGCLGAPGGRRERTPRRKVRERVPECPHRLGAGRAPRDAGMSHSRGGLARGCPAKLRVRGFQEFSRLLTSSHLFGTCSTSPWPRSPHFLKAARGFQGCRRGAHAPPSHRSSRQPPAQGPSLLKPTPPQGRPRRPRHPRLPHRRCRLLPCGRVCKGRAPRLPPQLPGLCLPHPTFVIQPPLPGASPGALPAPLGARTGPVVCPSPGTGPPRAPPRPRARPRGCLPSTRHFAPLLGTSLPPTALRKARTHVLSPPSGTRTSGRGPRHNLPVGTGLCSLPHACTPASVSPAPRGEGPSPRTRPLPGSSATRC